MNLEKDKEVNEEAKMQRLVKRKKDNPTANAKNFDQENARMGVTNEVDLILD
jgi:hypothetical protein